jgi:hypothetical protein
MWLWQREWHFWFVMFSVQSIEGERINEVVMRRRRWDGSWEYRKLSVWEEEEYARVTAW